MYPNTTLSNEHRARLHALARHQAQVLRHAAVADFWRGAGRLCVRAVGLARHLVLRLTRLPNLSSGA